MIKDFCKLHHLISTNEHADLEKHRQKMQHQFERLKKISDIVYQENAVYDTHHTNSKNHELTPEEFYHQLIKDKFYKKKLEDQMIWELMKTDCGFGTMSKDTNKAIQHNHIIAKYNRSLNMTLKHKKQTKFLEVKR